MARPKTGQILLSAGMTLLPPIYTHPSLLGFGPEATVLRLKVIFPTEPKVTPTHPTTLHISESCSRSVKRIYGCPLFLFQLAFSLLISGVFRMRICRHVYSLSLLTPYFTSPIFKISTICLQASGN